MTASVVLTDAERTRRHHNARRNPGLRASLVFDDLTWEPYQPRGVKLLGSMEAPAIGDDGRFSVQRPDGSTAVL